MKGARMRHFVIFVMLLLAYKSVSNVDWIPSGKIIDIKQLECLVKNAYHEAFIEGPIGMLLVTQVVFNRAKIKNKTYCEIIFEKSQFSWTLFKHKNISERHWKAIEHLIIEYYNGMHSIPEHLKNATHFHANYVKPYWRKHAEYLGEWRRHMFYHAENYR